MGSSLSPVIANFIKDIDEIAPTGLAIKTLC
jgi:hypothetical protein